MRQDWYRHIPNLLSSSRIALAFAFPFVPAEWRIAVIVIALLTEFFDGFLARQLNAISKLGQLLDPIADKLFVLATVLVLVAEQRLSILQLGLVAMRDIVVAAGCVPVLLLSPGRYLPRFLPRPLGKATTALQFLLLVLLYMNAPWTLPVLYLTAAVSCASAVDYAWALWKTEIAPATATRTEKRRATV